MNKSVLVAASAVLAITAVCTAVFAAREYSTNNAEPASVTVSYFDPLRAGQVTLRYTGDSFNSIDIHRDDSNGHFIRFHSEDASGKLMIDTTMVGGGVTNNTRTLVTAGWCDACEEVSPTKLVFDGDNIYMEELNVNAAMLKCAYETRADSYINPSIVITFAGSLYVYGALHPAIVTIESGGTDLPAALSSYTIIDRFLSPEPPPANNPPTLANFSITTAFGNATTMNLRTLSHAHDLQGDPISFSVTGQPFNGSVAPTTGERVAYTPDDSFAGYDYFVFKASDGKGGITSGTGAVRVLTNTLPVIANISTTTTKGTPVDILLVTEPVDADGHAVHVYYVGPPLNGTTAPSGFASATTTTVVYTPYTSFTGTDAFFYTLGDDKGGMPSANVTVDVTP